ncbi:MAG: type I glyceraldehyde-3-phosphate dehydrogenase [Firmicutes bacterium]|nr:type I glyceraldehyde-3-phosphate dehydrogenase [Bacillota bacterium]
MVVKVGINGFGRIGRLAFRIAWENPELEIVAINGRANTQTLAHLLKYDSNHGRYQREVTFDDNNIYIDGKAVRIFKGATPADIPWDEVGAELILESTGKFKTAEEISGHFVHGAKKALLSAPGKGDDILTVVYGVNHDLYDPEKYSVVSNASCTTTCMAPVLKIVDREFGINRGTMTTVHAYTNDQQILDKSHKDLRRARNAASSIIPTSTGAAKAVAQVLPQLKGKIIGYALRVPVPNVSLVDLTLELAKEVTAAEVNAALKAASEGELKGVLAYTEEPLVSCDYMTTEASGTVDALSTSVVGGNMVKLLAWYDNEWGYSCRIVDMLQYMGERM